LTSCGEKEQELEAARRPAQLQQRAGLTTVTVPVLPAGFAQLLSKTFADISTDAERRVAEHVARHQMQAWGETWLAEGLRYIAGEECPFGGQGLTGIDLIQAYRSFFSREYHALRDEVTGLSGQVEGAVGDRLVAAIDQTVLQNDNSLEFWRQYCEIVLLAFPEAGRTGKVMTALRQSAQSLLQIKARTPLDAVAPDDDFTQALAAFEAHIDGWSGLKGLELRAGCAHWVRLDDRLGCSSTSRESNRRNDADPRDDRRRREYCGSAFFQRNRRAFALFPCMSPGSLGSSATGLFRALAWVGQAIVLWLMQQRLNALLSSAST
jgi:hypothetical protein